MELTFLSNVGWQMGISVYVSGTLWTAGCGKQACPHVLLDLGGKHWCGKQACAHVLLNLGGKLWCGQQAYLHFLLELYRKLQGVIKQLHAFQSDYENDTVFTQIQGIVKLLSCTAAPC
jgi:hypothetical protein